jgi:methylmalonyl-CoA mutase
MIPDFTEIELGAAPPADEAAKRWRAAVPDGGARTWTS